MTELRRNEITGMLMQLNAWFGSKFIGQAPAISLYGLFDTHLGVIFPVSILIIWSVNLNASNLAVTVQ